MLVFLPLDKVTWIFLIYVMFLLKKILASFYSFGCQDMILYSAHFAYYLYVFQFMIKTDAIDYESEFHLGYLSAKSS